MRKTEPAQLDHATVEHTASVLDDVLPRLANAVRQYEQPLLHYTVQMLPDRPDQAQDVVQETFLRLRAAFLNGTDITHTRSWLYRVAHNLAMDLNKHENRHCQLPPDSDAPAAAGAGTGEDCDPGPAVNLCRREAQELAWRELRSIPADERQVLLLKLLEGMTLREISDLTDTNIGTVHYRLNCGLRKLAARFRSLGATWT